MKYALNKKKGTLINHPKYGRLEGGVAIPILDEDVPQLKNIYNIVIFDEVAEIPPEIREEIKEVVKPKDLEKHDDKTTPKPYVKKKSMVKE